MEARSVLAAGLKVGVGTNGVTNCTNGAAGSSGDEVARVFSACWPTELDSTATGGVIVKEATAGIMTDRRVGADGAGDSAMICKASGLGGPCEFVRGKLGT